MNIENLHVGDAVTILRGRPIHTCPAGCCRVEAYAPLKGMPFVVAAINTPYVVGLMVVGKGGAVLDTRDCELTKVGDEYVAAFRQMSSVKLGAVVSEPAAPGEGGHVCQGK